MHGCECVLHQTTVQSRAFWVKRLRLPVFGPCYCLAMSLVMNIPSLIILHVCGSAITLNHECMAAAAGNRKPHHHA
jgi:hypothetical protein